MQRAAVSAMSARQLQDRTARVAHALFRAWRPHLRAPDTRHVASQVIRSSSSAAANYRAARLSRSRAEFVAKMGLVREEADETVFWLEYAQEVGITIGPVTEELMRESRELSAIFSAAYRTCKKVGK
jgi:four helix bundle protein